MHGTKHPELVEGSLRSAREQSALAFTSLEKQILHYVQNDEDYVQNDEVSGLLSISAANAPAAEAARKNSGSWSNDRPMLDMRTPFS